MPRPVSRPIALNLRVSPATKEKLLKLRELMSGKLGARLSLTQTVEAAIDQTLASLSPEQNREAGGRK